LQLFYLNVAYVSHTCCKRMSDMFHLFQMYVAFECFMLQVQTTGVGVHEGGQGQAAATDAWRRRRPPPTVWEGGTGCAVLLWKRRGESLVWPGRDGRRVGVEEAGASHPSSLCNGSEAGGLDVTGGLDVSVGNKAGTGGRRIRANGVEQPAADFWTDASGRPGAGAAKKFNNRRCIILTSIKASKRTLFGPLRRTATGEPRHSAERHKIQRRVMGTLAGTHVLDLPKQGKEAHHHCHAWFFAGGINRTTNKTARTCNGHTSAHVCTYFT
jgi:hypothetical protein